ncbi:MAG: CHAT domain-containing protein, partial [Planctomycetota bacterium]
APRVVLLAACDTGRSHTRKGDPAVGDLGGIFLSAGSSAVVLADRAIERDAAFLFVKAFTEAYAGNGEDAGKAALEARRAVAGRPGFEHPHYWAALRLVGWSGARTR